ncbi:hypothetical protein L1987_80693 [Smallanthus sonchifolius]|uniref:Uncharacterized protein n=1 Tax=Smallanthus sonchifolius TaxID=185202 RepID=A0ACB8YPG1_9ASTR|nr:hypothetical protein L1987_80693 [Smallanthus sonchifolius]
MLAACVDDYFSDSEPCDKAIEDPIYENYKAVLDSKSTNETLTPKSVRLLFKDPCTRLATEVSKALLELANSFKNHRQCSPEILSDHLHQALQDLDSTMKSQPRLFIGPDMLTLVGGSKPEKHLSSVNTEASDLYMWRTKKLRSLRPTLSKITITSLEFSEALPIAAFAALLVEAVAKLDLVIEQVEELGRIACFKEFEVGDDVILNVQDISKREISLPCNVAD